MFLSFPFAGAFEILTGATVWYFQTEHTWDWLGTGMFKSPPLSLHRHREDPCAELHPSSQILKRFSFPQSFSLLPSRESPIRDHVMQRRGCCRNILSFPPHLA